MTATTRLEERDLLSTFTPKNSYDIHVDEEFGITEAVATLDNGDFGSRTIRFETGQLARQADGSETSNSGRSVREAPRKTVDCGCPP